MEPLQVLGLAPGASLDDAEDAYRRLLLIHHPDLHHDADAHHLAGAEHTTRQLNDAIAQVRAGVRTSAFAGASVGTDRQPSSGPWWATTTADDASEYGEPATDAANETTSSSSTRCPMCGTPLHTAGEMRTHVAVVHDLHLDQRLRPHKHRRRRRRPWLGLAFHSPWALLPVNALGSLVLAILAGQLTHDVMFARWTFAVGMAPTIIRTLTRGHH